MQELEASIAKHREEANEARAEGNHSLYELRMIAAIVLQDVALAYSAAKRETIRRKSEVGV